MIPGLLGDIPLSPVPGSAEPQVLIVTSDPLSRSALASQLLDAGFAVTTSGAYGVVELLEESPFDLLVTAQAFEEMAHFGVPQLARSMHPHLPILVLDAEAATGDGMVEAVQDALERWPLRARPIRLYH